MNCRFCGGAQYYPTKIKKNKTITACSNNKCPIFGVRMTVKQWEQCAPTDIECYICNKRIDSNDIQIAHLDCVLDSGRYK